MPAPRHHMAFGLFPSIYWSLPASSNGGHRVAFSFHRETEIFLLFGGVRFRNTNHTDGCMAASRYPRGIATALAFADARMRGCIFSFV